MTFAYLGHRLVARQRALVARKRALDTEIAQRAAAERELFDSEARKTTILDSADDAIIAMDHKGLITDFNRSAERVFGRSSAAVIGQSLADILIPEAYREDQRRGLSTYLQTGEHQVLGKRIELFGLHANGTEFPIELSITAIERDGFPSFTACARDITERMESEAKLKQAFEDAEQSQKEVEEFNRFAVDRETRMIDLKEEVNLLLVAAGQKPRYQSVWAEDEDADG